MTTNICPLGYRPIEKEEGISAQLGDPAGFVRIRVVAENPRYRFLDPTETIREGDAHFVLSHKTVGNYTGFRNTKARRFNDSYSVAVREREDGGTKPPMEESNQMKRITLQEAKERLKQELAVFVRPTPEHPWNPLTNGFLVRVLYVDTVEFGRPANKVWRPYRTQEELPALGTVFVQSRDNLSNATPYTGQLTGYKINADGTIYYMTIGNANLYPETLFRGYTRADDSPAGVQENEK